MFGAKRRLFAAIIFIFTPEISYSFIGNISFGGVHLPCAVACGGSRGIVNLGFGGDAINSFVTGPSIEGFRNAANQAADRATANLDAVLTKQSDKFFDTLVTVANTQRDIFFNQLNNASQSALGDLDDVLQRELRQADQVLETRLGTLDVVLNRNTQELSSALKRFLIFGLIIGMLAYVTWLIYQTKFVQKKSLRAYVPRIGAVCGLFMGLAAILFVINLINDYWARREVIAQFEQYYSRSLAEQNFDYAVYYATQLQFIDRFNALSSARAEKAQVLRDVFSRPALYRSSNGARELLSRVSNAQKGFFRASGKLDLDLNILTGFALWQRGDDRFSEYVAACILAHQIENAKGSEIGQLPSLLPFAIYYVTAYLSNPLPDDVVVKLYQDDSGQKAGDIFKPGVVSQDDSELTPFSQRYRIEQLKSIVSGTKVDIDRLARSNPLYAFVRVSLESVSTYRQVVSQYSELLRLNGTLLVTAEGPKKAGIRAAIRLSGQKIVDAWDLYEKFLNRPDYSDQTAKLNNFRGLWPIYTHALGATLIKDTDNFISAAPEDKGVQRRWLSDVVQASVRESTYKIMAAATHADFVVIDAKLTDIEKLTFAYINAVEQGKPLLNQASPAGIAATAAIITSGRAVALAASELGLMGCKNGESENFDCATSSSLPEPFGTLLFRASSTLDEKVVILNFDPIIKQLASARMIPAF